MPELIVRIGRNDGSLRYDGRTLPVFDVTRSSDRVPLPAETVAKELPVAILATRASVPVISADQRIRPPCCYQHTKSIPVLAYSDTGVSESYSKRMFVYDMVPSAQTYITPADDNPIEDEAFKKVSDITMDLSVSYDSYFRFQTRSEDGFRAVLGDDDTVIPSSSDGYEVEAPRVGQRVKRTVITNTGLNLIINLNPSIVKNYSLSFGQ